MNEQEIEKAIIDLQEYIGSGEYNGSNPPIYLNTAELAIQALEKQIPKKVIPKVFEDGYAGCPSCKNKLFDNQLFCDRCGQAIDWRNKDE